MEISLASDSNFTGMKFGLDKHAIRTSCKCACNMLYVNDVQKPVFPLFPCRTYCKFFQEKIPFFTPGRAARQEARTNHDRMRINR